MTTIDPTTPDLTSLRDRLLARFAHLRRSIRRHLLIEGVARVLALAVGMALLSLVLDRWLRLSLPARLVLLAGGVAWLAYEVWRQIILPLRAKMDAVGLATSLDTAAADGQERCVPIAARVATVLQLPRLLDAPAPPSPAMVERAVVRSYESLEAVDLEQRLDRQRMTLFAAAIALVVLVPIIFATFAPATASLWARRWFAGSIQPWPQKTYLDIAGVSDGRIIVPRGEPYVLRVAAADGSIVPEKISLTLREPQRKKTSAAMTRFGENDFRYDLPPVNVPVEIRLRGGDDAPPPIVVEPVDRPRIASMQLISQHPLDAQATQHRFTGQEADLAFLPMTALELRFTANVPIREARLRSNNSPPAPESLQRIDERSFIVRWTHEQAVQLQIELVESAAGLSSLPTPLAIGLKTDQPPRVTLQYSGVRQRITPHATIPTTVLARDDYGIASVELAMRIEPPVPSDATTAPAPQNLARPLYAAADAVDQREIQQRHDIDVDEMKLAVGTLVSLSAQATDARYLGPQTSQSRPAVFRVVLPEELFREILVRQQGERAKFRKQIDEAQKLRDQLATLATNEEAKALARQHRMIQRETARIAESMSQTATEMRLNRLGGPEAWELMDRNVLRPLRELDQLTNPQRDALDALSPDDADQLAAISERQDQIIERMKEILKQMSQWDSFVDVLNQLNEIIKLQELVKQSTDQLKSRQTDSVFE